MSFDGFRCSDGKMLVFSFVRVQASIFCCSVSCIPLSRHCTRTSATVCLMAYMPTHGQSAEATAKRAYIQTDRSSTDIHAHILAHLGPLMHKFTHTHRHTCAHSSVAQCCDGFCKMEFGCGVELAGRIHCEGPWAGNSNMKFGSPGSYPEVPTACQHASPVRVYNQS